MMMLDLPSLTVLRTCRHVSFWKLRIWLILYTSWFCILYFGWQNSKEGDGPLAWQPAYDVHDDALYKSMFFTFFTLDPSESATDSRHIYCTTEIFHGTCIDKEQSHHHLCINMKRLYLRGEIRCRLGVMVLCQEYQQVIWELKEVTRTVLTLMLLCWE